jgi:hypothetical protein
MRTIFTKGLQAIAVEAIFERLRLLLRKHTNFPAQLKVPFLPADNYSVLISKGASDFKRTGAYL